SWPALVAVGALLMASGLKIPKLGLSRSRALSVFIMGNVVIGYACGATRHLPELLCFDATMWVLSSIVWGQVNHDVKALRPPPIFPQTDRPSSQLPLRPEEDALPDDDEEHDDHGEVALSK